MSFESSPFHGDLSAMENTNNRIWELSGHPDHIIRSELSVSEHNTQEALEELSRTRTLLDELETEYEIKNPGYSPVIAGPETAKTIQPAVVTARVHGIGLTEAIEKNVPGLLDEVDVLYCNLARYLGDKYKSGQPYMGDIFAKHQYRYGYTEKDTESRIFLVDVGAVVVGGSESENSFATKFPEVAVEWDAVAIVTTTADLYKEITGLSEKIGKQFKAYEEIITLLNSVDVKNSNASELVALINKAHSQGLIASEGEISKLQDRL